MKYFKKASSFLLMAALLLSGTNVANVANAASYTEEDDGISKLWKVGDIFYRIDFTTGTASYENDIVSGDTLVIPESITYKGKKYPVTTYSSTGYNASISKVRHIVFPDTMRGISVNTRTLPNLESFNIPKNAEAVYTRLRSNIKVTVPADQKYFYEKNNALYFKKEPTVMYMPLSIPKDYTIAEGTTKVCSFNRNQVIEKVTFPKSVTTIDDKIFSYCRKLKEVNMEKSQIKKLSENAFEFTSKLTSVKLPAQLETIHSYAFYNSGIEKVTFPKHLKKIVYGAFKNTNLKKAIIPDSVTHIGSDAFANCKSLKEVIIPKKLRSVNVNTFANCKKLKKITFRNTKTAPKFVKKGTIFKGCSKGIKLYVKNKKVAKSLKKQLMKTSIKKAKIYAGKKLVYKNVTGKEKIKIFY